MKDCVGKPFVSQDLWRCLLKYFTPVEWKDDTPKKITNADEARELLATLKPLLESGNPDCLKLLDALRSIPKADEPLIKGPLILKLIQQMEGSDFKQAKETLAELLD
jgi:hypothetical protein